MKQKLVENETEVLNKSSSKDRADFLADVSMGKRYDKDFDGNDTAKFKTKSINTSRRKRCDGLGCRWDT